MTRIDWDKFAKLSEDPVGNSNAFVCLGKTLDGVKCSDSERKALEKLEDALQHKW